MDLSVELLERIETRTARVGVVGLGYVGLPVAVACAETGFHVSGVEASAERLALLQSDRSYVTDVDEQRLGAARRSGRLVFGSSYDILADSDIILICVPTPIEKGAPDVSAITVVGNGLSGVLKRGSLVILESTTYPGTTEELLKPLLESSGSRVERDFFLAFSPERIDPGNPSFRFEDIPKVVGGAGPTSTYLAETFYSQVVPKVVPVSGTREAEMSKLIENTFRHVNIALVNELAMYARDLDVDIWEAISAAASKPFGFLPFWPGPGWGGHCIPLDPSYLSWRVRQDRAHEVRFIELAQTLNDEMPRHIIERITVLLNDRSKPVKGSRILGVGAAYKGGTDDVRGSPGISILSTLAERGADVSYHDPLVPEASIGGRRVPSVDLDRGGDLDLVVIFINQMGVDWDAILRADRPIFDCCNAIATAIGARHPNVTRL